MPAFSLSIENSILPKMQIRPCCIHMTICNSSVKYLYHRLAKFEHYRMIRTIQNFKFLRKTCKLFSQVLKPLCFGRSVGIFDSIDLLTSITLTLNCIRYSALPLVHKEGGGSMESPKKTTFPPKFFNSSHHI